MRNNKETLFNEKSCHPLCCRYIIRITEKVVNYIASAIDADVIDLLKNRNPSIEQYELIILASGIYFGSFHKVLLEYMKATSFEGKNVIVVYNPVGTYRNYAKSSEKILA